MVQPLRQTPTDAPADPTLPRGRAAATQAETRTPPRALADRHGAFAWPSWRAMLPPWLGRRGLSPDQAGCYAAPFTASVSSRERYAALFDLREAASGTDYPFLLGQRETALLQARVLADLGLNRRRLRHVRHHTRWLSGAAAILADPPQRLECRLLRAVHPG